MAELCFSHKWENTCADAIYLQCIYVDSWQGTYCLLVGWLSWLLVMVGCHGWFHSWLVLVTVKSHFFQILFFMTHLLLPMYFYPVWHVVLLFITAELASGYYLAFVFQVTTPVRSFASIPTLFYFILKYSGSKFRK